MHTCRAHSQLLLRDKPVEATLGRQEDRDNGLGKSTGSDGIVQEGLDAADRFNVVESESEETISRGRSELRRLGSSKTDGLTDLDTSNADIVRAEDTRGGRAISVADTPLATVLLVCRGLGRVETDVLLAGGGCAAARGEPDV